jgi:hypothetical protein
MIRLDWIVLLGDDIRVLCNTCLEKIYDKILKNIMGWILHKLKISTKYIRLTKDMFNNNV